jgi:hypothetical protein
MSDACVRACLTTAFTAAVVSAPMALSGAWRAAGPVVTLRATMR